ncbi:MAG: NUDIX hydrolase [Bacteroidota bacterium]
MDPKSQLNKIKRIKAIAETGLVYTQGNYDKERYEELRELALEFMAHLSGVPMQRLNNFFLPQLDYPTPKVDVRAFVLNTEGHLLMAREQIDGKWTIPGGWTDIGNTPKEVVIKEIKEETGLDARVMRLLAVYDKRCHPHPHEAHYIYKMVFYCQVMEGTLQPGFDILDAAWFPLDQLPELSEDRILESQIRHLNSLVEDDVQETYCD